MKNIASSVILAGLLLGQVSACQTTNTPNPAPESSSSSGLRTLSAPSTTELSQLRDSELPEANRRFSFSLFQDLLQESPRENLFVSPLSVSMALSMLYNGASGETQQEMASALAYQNLSIEALNQGQLTLRKRLQNSGEGVEILVANALWGKAGLQFQNDFLAQNSAFYDARLEALDFGKTAAVDRINQWASDNTKGLIPKVVEEIDPQTLLLLMNAIYFKGSWSTPFQAEQTQSLPFYKADDTQVEQAMMTRYGKWRYADVDGTQLVSLPYGKAERTEMLVFLPPKGQALDQWATQMDADAWRKWQSALRSRDGRVTLPKFKIKNTLALNDTLKRLGMVKAFSETDASLDGLLQSTETTPFVSAVKQDAFVEVNEKGTEAAAVTTVTVGATSVVMPQNPFEMTLDRPFVYVIYDRETESLLFMGAFNSPAD